MAPTSAFPRSAASARACALGLALLACAVTPQVARSADLPEAAAVRCPLTAAAKGAMGTPGAGLMSAGLDCPEEITPSPGVTGAHAFRLVSATDASTTMAAAASPAAEESLTLSLPPLHAPEIPEPASWALVALGLAVGGLRQLCRGRG